MDKLEQTKSTNTTNDAIIDDVAAKAYIENFALETFNRADEAQRANKVTKQTADAFMAAVTFMDLLNIWGEPEKEIKDKSKFAKYHATRILKAFKAGEDPNATNPVVEEPSVPAPAPDELDEELKALETQQNGGQGWCVQIADSRRCARRWCAFATTECGTDNTAPASATCASTQRPPSLAHRTSRSSC